MDTEDCEDYTDYEEWDEDDDSGWVWMESSFRKYTQNVLDTELSEYELYKW